MLENQGQSVLFVLEKNLESVLGVKFLSRLEPSKSRLFTRCNFTFVSFEQSEDIFGILDGNSGNRLLFTGAKIKKNIIKFIYSKKATKFCEIFPLLLSYVVPVESKVKILQNSLEITFKVCFKYILSSL